MTFVRALLLALMLATGLCGEALAQGCGPANPNCVVTTPPPGDSSNRAASTAFVNDPTNGIFARPHSWSALQTFNGGIAGSGPINMLNTTTPANLVTTPGYSFNDNGIVGGNFGDGNVHVAMTVTGNSPATGTGGYTGILASQFGVGRSSAAFVTAIQANAIAIGGNGNFTGVNPYTLICGTVIDALCPLGTPATVASAVGAEIDIEIRAGATALYKEALRIADLGAVQASGAGNLSAAIAMVRASASPGFVYGLYFGDPTLGDANFPLTTTGAAMKLSTSARAIDSIIDGSGLAGGVTNGAIRLPDSVTGIKWTSWSLLETNGLIAFQIGGTLNAALFQAALSTFSGTVQSGNPGTNAGAFILQGLTSGTVTIAPGNANAGTVSFTLPVTNGTSNFLLTSQGGSAMTWTSPTVTVNSVACTLGSTCSISAASSLVVGTSTITGAACTNGFNLYNNSGVLGCQANGAGSTITVGTTPVASGTTQQILYDNAGTLGEITKGNSCVYGTNGSGVPSCVTTLPFTVSLATGGTNANLAASNGGILYSGASAFAVLTGTVTAGQCLLSGSSAAPTWGACVTGQVALANGGTNANLTASNGGIVYSTASAFAVLAGTVTAGQCLLSGSSAAPTWGACSGASGLTIGSTTITSGTTQQLLYDNAGVVGEITKGNNCVYGTNGSGVPSCVTTLPSAVTASSLTSVGTLTGMTSSGTINVNTVTGTMLNATSLNTGGFNIFQIGNSGVSTNGNTKAIFQMALTDGACGIVCDFQLAVSGNATTPFAFVATDTGLTGGFFMSSAAGPIVYNGKTNLQFLVNSGAAFDCNFTSPATCTFASAVVAPKLTANGLIANGAAPTGNTGSCTSGVTVTGGATAGNWTSTSACNIAGTIILGGMPTAPTGYACDAWDITTANVVLQPTGSTVNSHTWTVRSTNAPANDNIRFKCIAY